MKNIDFGSDSFTEFVKKVQKDIMEAKPESPNQSKRKWRYAAGSLKEDFRNLTNREREDRQEQRRVLSQFIDYIALKGKFFDNDFVKQRYQNMSPSNRVKQR